MNERMTCPVCNCTVTNGRCTNTRYCTYSGKGWTTQDRIEAWSGVGQDTGVFGKDMYDPR